MSLRVVRRSLIAAASLLAVCGSLAVVGSASAAAIPWGSSTDTASTSVYGLYNQASAGLVSGEGLIYGANALAGMGFGTAVDATFTSKFTSATQLTATNVASIATDFASSANTGQLELSICVFDVYPAATSDTSVPDAVTACTSGPEHATLMAEAATLFTTGAGSTPAIAPGIATAAAGWPQLSDLLNQLEPFGGTLYSLDSGVTVGSAATVTGKGKPTVYSITAATSGSAASGYVLPSGFTMTFPNTFSVNTALAGAELPVADEASPPSASAIGTVTLKTPVASEFGGSNGQITGSVYVINANGSITQPDLELSFGSGIYLLGTFPKVLAFPLTMTFGEASVAGSPDPIPFSSLAINFPAKTSPVKALNCSNLGSVGGTGTDEIASLAAEFGDASDSGTITFGSTPTVVTDLCPPKAGATKIAGIKKGAPNLKVVIKSDGSTKFNQATITLPSGLTAKGLKAKGLKVSGAKLKSVSGKGAKVTLNFKSATRSATVKVAKGLVASSKLKTGVTKKKTKSLSLKLTVKYVPAGMAATTSGVTAVTVKGLS